MKCARCGIEIGEGKELCWLCECKVREDDEQAAILSMLSHDKHKLCNRNIVRQIMSLIKNWGVIIEKCMRRILQH